MYGKIHKLLWYSISEGVIRVAIINCEIFSSREEEEKTNRIDEKIVVGLKRHIAVCDLYREKKGRL